MAKSYLGGHSIVGDSWMGRSSQGSDPAIDHAAADKVVREVRPPYKPEKPKGARRSKSKKPREQRSIEERRADWIKAFEEYREKSDLADDPRGHSRTRQAMERIERGLPASLRNELVATRLKALDEMREARSGLKP